MELYLDSADIKEIEEASHLDFLTGLTTTPTFMYREKVADVDTLLLRLSKMMPIIQIEALGDTAEEILEEAQQKLAMGLNPQKTVFKIPVSMEGVRACRLLRKEQLLVNLHLVYTLQQAYMAMLAGATYVCPLVGRLQDQGHDALALVDECVAMTEHYGFTSKIMFSSVRNVEHVRNALNIGVHTITAPWKIIKELTNNNFTTLGTMQFVNHTRLMTAKVQDVMSAANPIVRDNLTLQEAIIKMTEYGFGAVTVVDIQGILRGVFTDGDLRKKIQEQGREVINKTMGAFSYHTPITIAPNALLNEALELFNKTKVDTLLVVEQGKPVGMLDIQDIEMR